MDADTGENRLNGVVKTIVQGGLIGVANVIPGVSGGTLALMLGIYKRTIDAVRSVNLVLMQKVLKVLRREPGSWDALWQHARETGLFFLAWLGAGAVIAIVAFARVMSWLLKNQQEPSYAFFGGLVFASMLFPWRSLTRRSWRELMAFFLGCVLVLGLSLSVSDQERVEKFERKHVMAEEKASGLRQDSSFDPVRLLVVFAAAVLAISAMVLPGISGSFLLLLLGVYPDILAAINQLDLVVLGVFALGSLAGLLVFTRLVGVLLDRIFNLTMAFMIGLMAGSLYELWPFKRQTVIHGEILLLGNRWQDIDPVRAGIILMAGMAGILLVAGFAVLSRHTDEMDSQTLSKI